MMTIKAPAKLTRGQARSFVMMALAAHQPDLCGDEFLAEKYLSNYEPGAWVIDAVMDAYQNGYQGGSYERQGGSSGEKVKQKMEEKVTGLDAGEVPVLSDFWRATPTTAYWAGTIISSLGWIAWIAFDIR